MTRKQILDLLFRDLTVAITTFNARKILCGTCVCAQVANNMSAICNLDAVTNQFLEVKIYRPYFEQS
jgi:hypothetical protein